MQVTRLIDVCDVQYGYPFDSKLFSESDGMPLIRIRDVVRGYSETFTTEEYKQEYVVHQGDILVGMDGEFNIAKWGKIPALLNQRVCRIFPKETADSDYIFHALPKALKKIEDRTSFVTVKHLSAKEINKITIPFPSLEKQHQIATILNTLQSIIAHRKQQLAKLDELVKARFVEMFGNPVSNSKKWETLSLGKLTSKIGSGATPKGGRESYGTEGISLIRSMNVHNGLFEYKDLAHISNEQAEKLDNVTIQENDVLLNITGASVARCCIVPNDILPARVNQHVCIVRCKKEILPAFLCSLLIDDNYQKHLWNIAGSGATREAITKQQVENLSIIVPPYDLQEQFATFVSQTDKSKFLNENVTRLLRRVKLYDQF